MAIKERRIKCAACGERETVIRGERGPISVYCDVCHEERKREQARLRMAALRDRQRAQGSSSFLIPRHTDACAPQRHMRLHRGDIQGDVIRCRLPRWVTL